MDIGCKVLVFFTCFLTVTAEIYIVTMEGEPIISYKGGDNGFEATAVESDEKIDTTSELVTSYARHLERKHDMLLGMLFVEGSYKKLYSYKHLINGFAAHVSPDQAEMLRRAPGVKSVDRDWKVRKLTTHTPQFLGLPTDVWPTGGGYDRAGEDIVIGFIDSGIFPHHPSFASHHTTVPYGPHPSYKGKCEEDPHTKISFCNGKIIGAQHFAEAAKAAGAFNPDIDFASPMDGDGHGSHTAAIAAGNNGIPVRMHGYEFGKASGMAPRARIAVYKALYRLFGGFVADVVAAIDQAVHDGVDILSLSVGPNSPPATTKTTFLNPFDATLLGAVKAGVFVAQAAGNGGPFPKTLVSYSPWITTVAAAIDDRRYKNHLTLGNGKMLAGIGLSPSTRPHRSYKMVSANDVLLGSSGMKYNPSDCQKPEVLNKKLVEGNILLCGYSFNFVAGSASIKKVAETAKHLGAAGFVLVVENVSPGTKFDPVPSCIPGILLGTNCPIPPRWNFTYQFQVKDQIGSFFYSPSLNFQRASGGFGPIVINNRDIIPIPFPQPDGELIFIIGDWYTQDHKALRRALDSGKELGMPDGVLINGKGPYKYNSSVPDGIDYLTFHVEPGKTYRIRVHNVGISTSLNFRIQNHSLLLVETEGHYTSQANFTDFDVHVGQSYSFLVTMDQDATSDYYIVASARFVNETVWQRVTGVAILHYSNSKGPVSGPLPVPKTDVSSPWSAMSQPKTIRQNTSASGARPNPQGSFHYGQINITNTYILRSLPPTIINGALRATLNGISFVNPSTPVRLADRNKVKGAYKLDFPDRPFNRPLRLDRSMINATYKGFIQVVFQNNDTKIQSFHVDGYSFFVVGMDFGIWSEDKKGSYNNWDAISRSTIEVYPGGWTAVLISLDNVGVWNIRVENLDRWYLGEETYMRITNPEEDGKTEMDPPDNVLYCGALKNLQKEQHHSAATSILNGHLKLMLLMVLLASVFRFC